MIRQILQRRTSRNGFSLIELLVAMVIMVALGSALFVFYAGHSKPGQKGESPIERGHDPVCMNNLSQIRQALTMAQTDDEGGKFPATLQELKGIPAEMFSCPVGHEPYQYDPATGRVSCVHPGHEKF